MNSVRHLASGSPRPLVDNTKPTLYGMRFCPCTHRVHLMLTVLLLSYNLIHINLMDKPEWYKQVNPVGLVPTLGIPNKNVTLRESLIISEYLNEMYIGILPRAGPLERALDRLLIDKFTPIKSALHKIYTSKTGLWGVKDQMEIFLNNLDAFEKELKVRRTKFFGGNHPGMVDYMIWPWMERSEMIYYIDNSHFELDTVRFAKIKGWFTAMKSDVAVYRTQTSPRDHYRFMQTYINGTPDYDMLVRDV